MTIFRYLPTCACAAVLGCAGTTHALLIDDFSDTSRGFFPDNTALQPWPLVVGPSGTSKLVTDTPITGAVAGKRTVSLRQQSVLAQPTALVTTTVDETGFGTLLFGGGPGSAGRLSVSYDLTSLVLTGLDRVEVDFRMIDLFVDPLTVRATITDGVAIAASGMIAQSVDALGVVTLGIDLDKPVTSATQLTVLFEAGGSTDFVVDEIRFVPEPASLALLGLGGVVMLRRRRV